MRLLQSCISSLLIPDPNSDTSLPWCKIQGDAQLREKRDLQVYDFDDYKTFVNSWVASQPRKGYGQFRKMAIALNISSVVISQVFRSTRDLSPEQALKLTKHLALDPNETDYFLALVQKDRAGSVDLRDFYKQHLERLRREARALKNRMSYKPLDGEAQSVFYSSWQYSLVRLACSLNGVNNVNQLAQRLKIDPIRLHEVLDFLVRHKLVIQDKSGLRMGPSVTHVPHNSPHVNRHHLNWRVQAFKSLDTANASDLHYTGPMSVSEEAAESIREELTKLIKQATQLASSSRPNVLRCLTIDWFDPI